MEISKADWKLFRERIAFWQERYMEKLLKQYVKLLTSPGDASEHFWELDKKMKQAKKHPGVLIQLDKGNAIWDIAILVKKKVITMKDLDGFSNELIEAVTRILDR